MTSQFIGLKVVFAFFVCCFLIYSPQTAQAKEDKEKAIDEYFKVYPIKEMVFDMSEKVALNLPEHVRPQFIHSMKIDFDWEGYLTQLKYAMRDTYTLEEIKAMTKFFGSPVGRSILLKTGEYSSKTSRFIQAEVKRIAEKSLEESSMY